MGGIRSGGGRLDAAVFPLRVAVASLFVLAALAATRPDAPAATTALRAKGALVPAPATTAVASLDSVPPPTATIAPSEAPPDGTVAAAVASTPTRPAIALSPSLLPQPPRTTTSQLAPYEGLGTWLDVYDWSQTYTRDGAPSVGPADVDRMSSVGVQTLYIQASKHDAPSDVLEPERLVPLIDRAHQHGMRVVAWYLPTLVDPARDMQRLLAIATLDIDGLAVDIEARNVEDVGERNRRLVALSRDLRSALPDRALGAIVLPPVQLEEVNRAYWPNFPWTEIAPLYDVWQTMGYWTDRKASSGWRDAHDYTVENVVRLRRNLGQPDAMVHAIGGIGHKTTPADIDGFRRAAVETHCAGGSLYDWRTTQADAWPGLQAFRT